ncbi:Uncharacterised protein [Mycoplasmopsis maculosa]|uniref:DUF31 domain-containing protein n=1 Tax=Mycoplasmopsis maculosa TaxID=114885 RepID=A0A449B3K9_9BACT|nr:hypothetical protein [Mycoplasmopsis maculosa]VEU75182.1 Uncharacterised protein [Mycoplasmopsis maculosa]
MKKRYKKFILNSLSLIGFFAPLAGLSNLNENVNSNSENLNLINNYFKNNNFSYFKIIKSTIFEDIKSKKYPYHITKNLISFLNTYKEILELKINKSYIQIKNNLNEDEKIFSELSEFDKIINTNNESYKQINDDLVLKIKSTLKKIKVRNNKIDENNKNFKEFIEKVNKLNLKSILLSEFINENILSIFNNSILRKLFFDHVIEIENNILFLENIIRSYDGPNLSDILEKALNEAKVFLKTFDKLSNIIQIKEKSTLIVENLNNIIISNNLQPNNLVKEIKKVNKKIDNSDTLNNHEKELLKNKLLNVIIFKQIIDIENIVQNYDLKLEELKKDLISKISSFLISEEIKNSLILKIKNFNSLLEFNSYKEKINLIQSKFSETLINIQLIKDKIFSNSIDNEQALFFYRKLIIINSFSNDNIINKLNPYNLDETLTLIEEANIIFKNILNSNSSENQSKSILELFKEQTMNVWKFEMTDNSKKYDLESYAYSLSYDLNNAKLFFDNYDTKEVDYEIVDLYLDENDKNTLVAKIKVSMISEPTISYEFSISKTLAKDANPIIEAININSIDEIFNFDYDYFKNVTINEFNNLLLKDKKNLFKGKKKKIFKYFNYEIDDDIEIKESKLFFTIKILFNNQIIRTQKISTKNTIEFLENEYEKESNKDALDLQKILEIVKSDTASFMSKIKFKEGVKLSHIAYLASDAKKAFDDLYIMPKFGKYEVFIKDLKNINDYNGNVDFILWYKKNGIEVPIENVNELDKYKKTISSFKLLNFNDIKPINNEVMTFNDFLSKNGEVISQKHRDLFNSINETNFKLRLTQGRKYNRKEYRALNLKDMIEQKAFINMEYLIELRNSDSNPQKSDNYSNEDYVPLGVGIYDKDLERNSKDLGEIRRNYFTYYYDVRELNNREMTFKLGFINKRNTNIRFTNGIDYKLINIVNDYQQALYPEIMVNNIKISDLIVNYDLLSKRKAEEFINNLDDLNNIITLKTNSDGKIHYKNFSLSSNLFKIVEIKRIANDEAYVKFGVRTIDGQIVKGNTWFKVKGFARSDLFNINEELTFTKHNLKTVQESNKLITRERVIEPYWDELFWSNNKRNNYVNWTLKRKYLEKTLLKENSRNRFIQFDIFANVLINDDLKNSRLRNSNNSISLKFSFDELVDRKNTIIERTSFNEKANVHFKYFIGIYWKEDEGIEFKIWMEDDSYKIILGEPETQKFDANVKFDKNRAFIVLPAAVKTTIRYTNDEEYENFELDQNRFDLKNIEYNQYGEPILFYSDLEFQKNKNVYYPNQNVDFKLHEGFKLNAEYVHIKQYRDWDVLESVYSRNLLVDGGYFFASASIIGKANDDPNDATFYIMTNNHVEGGSDFNAVSGNNFLSIRNGRKYAFVPDIIDNNVDRSWPIRTSEANTIHNNQIKMVWTGREQISKDGNRSEFRDLTIFSIDLNEKLRVSREKGNMQIVWKIENLMKMGSAKFNIHSSQIDMSVPNLKEISTIGWPRTQFAGSINRRTYVDNNKVMVSFQVNGPQIFSGGGASGSGMYTSGDRYFSTWVAGNGIGDSWGIRYENKDYNYFGINYNNENPLELKNYKSVASQIFKANLVDPSTYDLPWFLNEVKNGEE